jgi:4'-phosphopantetheinyl transferase EntD
MRNGVQMKPGAHALHAGTMDQVSYFDGQNTSISDLLNGVLPVGASYAAGLINQARGKLFPEEEHAIARAVPARRAEYIAGRYYARQAMMRLGLPPLAIPSAPSREPVWPCGTVGSISHAVSQCAAVVARKSSLIGIGIDIESDDPLHESILGIICTPDEQSTSSQLAKLRFVIKEAFYKLYFPLTHHFLDFHDVSVSIDLRYSTFTATLSDHCRPLNGHRQFAGKFGNAAGLYIALVWLPA